MGILDQFAGMSPEQNQGLLAAAAQMLQSSGPSLMPHSFGQVLGQGLQGYQAGMQGVQDRKMGELKMKALQSDLEQRQAMLDMQNRIRQRSLSDIQSPSAAQPQMPSDASGLMGGNPNAQLAATGLPTVAATVAQPVASYLPGGENSPKIGGPDWMQAYQATQQPGAQPAAAAAPQAQQAPTNLTQSVAARLARQAQIHAEEGDMDGANKLYEQATKFMPEVNKIEVGQDPASGKPINVITYKDGRQEVSKFMPKPDIHFADDGQHTAIPINGYTGQAMGAGLTRQATPDAMMTDRRAGQRLAFDQYKDKQDRADANEPAKPNETMAKQIAFYKAAPLGQFSLNKPWGQATMDRVMELNPEYDAAQYAPRAGALKAYAAGGKEALGIDSINIGMNHVATLRELALAQKNGNVQLFNKIANQWASATGQPAPTNLRMAADMVSPEVVKAVAGVAGTGEERAHFAKSLTGNGSYSPDQIIGATSEVQNLFAGRLSEKKRSYERSTKLDNFNELLSPAAQQLIGQKQAPAAPSAPVPKSVLKGQVMDGYKFKGGNPANPNDWEKM